ncbi:hypothetical protein [Natrarchaeobius chitinivorans]|uniref:hypothetical protein n=1 Tax=Natrarchaeobius chitinivorans TaxID=1679083 RepID=UPI00140517CB|nr:hypothetical protein [Natrarchaeobius chitinivorans]
MSSSENPTTETDDDLADPVCDRCGKPIPSERVIHLSSEPCRELAGRYAAVTRTYCPNCIAGIGMLEFTREARAHVESD